MGCGVGGLYFCPTLQRVCSFFFHLGLVAPFGGGSFGSGGLQAERITSSVAREGERRKSRAGDTTCVAPPTKRNDFFADSWNKSTTGITSTCVFFLVRHCVIMSQLQPHG